MRRKAAFVAIAVVLLLIPALPVAAKKASDDPVPPLQTQPTYITFVEPRLPLPARLGNVTVQFNPKEISVDKSVPWGHHDIGGNDTPDLEFTHGQPYTLSVELMFDGFETQTDVSPIASQLEKFVAGNETKRPPKIVITWGSTLPMFEGVIESFGVKYTLFLEDGTPCRATVSLHMTEAGHVPMHAHGNETSNETRA